MRFCPRPRSPADILIFSASNRPLESGKRWPWCSPSFFHPQNIYGIQKTGFQSPVTGSTYHGPTPPEYLGGNYPTQIILRRPLTRSTYAMLKMMSLANFMSLRSVPPPGPAQARPASKTNKIHCFHGTFSGSPVPPPTPADLLIIWVGYSRVSKPPH